jgi:hypothetical protein
MNAGGANSRFSDLVFLNGMYGRILSMLGLPGGSWPLSGFYRVGLEVRNSELRLYVSDDFSHVTCVIAGEFFNVSAKGFILQNIE